VVVVDDVCQVICWEPVRFDEYRVLIARLVSMRLRPRILSSLADNTIDEISVRWLYIWYLQSEDMRLSFKRPTICLLLRDVRTRSIIVTW